MSWFKKRPAKLQAPFPAERISALSIIIPGAIFRGLKLRQRSVVSPEQVRKSSFFNSYLCGYPRYLEEELDERMGGPIRYGLLRSILTCSDHEAQLRFDAFQHLMADNDRATWEAFRLAEADGAFYWKALIASERADDHATANLVLAIRGYEEFPEFATS